MYNHTIQVVVEGYVVAAALQHFGMRCIDAEDPLAIVTTLEKCTNIEERQSKFQEEMVNVVKQLWNLPIRPEKNPSRKEESQDGIFNYSQEVMTLGLLCMEFEDAIREGDGLRLLRVWKFLLLIFKAAHRKNYSIEALTILVQYYALLSPRQREQLLWSRFINMNGREGENKAADLHMEHLNHIIKTAIGHQSSNLTPKVLKRIGKCSGPLLNVCEQFDNISNVITPRGKQSKPSHEKDLRKIVEQLINLKAVQKIPGRKHKTIKPIRGSLVSSLDDKKFSKWLKQHLTDIQIASMEC